MSDSLTALRGANPRTRHDFADVVETATASVRARIAAPGAKPRAPRRRLGWSAIGVSLAGAVSLVVALMLAAPRGQDAAAAFERATALSAVSAERSGTAVVRITHGGELWAGTTIRWHGDDLSVFSDAPRRAGKAGSALLVVGGTVYGIEPGLGWVAMGTPRNIDPGSGTTPDEYLAAVREDVGGVTLQRITRGMTGLTMSELDDGSVIYRGSVAARLVARGTGFKEGTAIRVLPFGFVAHDQAADPAAPLDVAVTVGPSGAVSEVAVSWGTWLYRVAYSRLGATPAPVAPSNAVSLLELRAQAREGSGAVGRP